MTSVPPVFFQLFEPESSTYTYLIADPETGEAALIDPVLETVDRDLRLIEELGVRLKYVLDTHVHADHVTGAGKIRELTGAKTCLSGDAQVECCDIPLRHGDKLMLGNRTIFVRSTPGHTSSCLTYQFEDMLFTGDAILIRGTGRTDFQGGSAEALYQSIHEQIFSLPDSTRVFPGHDYRGQTMTTVGLEKKFNPRIGGNRSLKEFVQVMAELKLANPKKIHEAVPANMACGRPKDTRALHPQVADGIPEVTVEDVSRVVGRVRIIDVRRPDEFNNELGHIKTAELVTLGTDLDRFLDSGDRSDEIVFVCRSGGRSGTATAQATQRGYRFVMNMVGGMIQWNERRLPIEREEAAR